MKLFASLIASPIILAIFFFALPPLNVEKYFSPAIPALEQHTEISEHEYQLKELFVADMHADSLLWDRSIAERSEIGHADIHRLSEANVGLQIFMSVIEAPNDVTSNSIEQKGDQITTIATLDKWPYKTLSSYKERALYHAAKLFKAEKESDGKLKVVLTKEDLINGLDKWQVKQGPLLAILGLEGAHATEFQVENIDILFKAGFRSMELAHYSDTEFAGSSSGVLKYGLTEKGRHAVARMNEIGIIIDVAHLSPSGIIEVLKLSNKPIYSSHVGVYSTCPKARNMRDPLIKKIALHGGVIGIGFFEDAICDPSLDGIVRAITHVRNLVGSKHVALGSGWDIAPLAITPKQLPLLSKMLLEQGFSEKEIRDVMGKNVRRFFQNNLPSGKRG